MSKLRSSRRQFLQVGAVTVAGAAPPGFSLAPAVIAAESERPKVLHGLQFGDPADGSIVGTSP